jgi:S1-C subfamily serine protease
MFAVRGAESGRRRRLALPAAAAVLAAAAALGSSCATESAQTAGNAVSATPTPSRPLAAHQIAAAVSPALVDIDTTLGYQGAAAAGTGMVLTPSGEVLTNNHVVEGATSISVRDVGNGRTYQATSVGYDQTGDVAVLQLHGASGLKTVPLGNSSSVAAGHRVLGLGNAGGQGGTPHRALGYVTALGQSITAADQASGTSEQLTGLIQTNAPIRPGDSGGPLASDTAQVIGMNTAASSSYRMPSSARTQGFAIPVNTALSVAGRIRAGLSSSTVHVGPTGFLGVELANPGSGLPGSGGGAPGSGGSGGSGGSNGAVIAGVLRGGPAEKLGLTGGDTITSLAGQTVTSPSGVQKVVNQYHPGDKVSIGWTDRSGQSQSGTLTLTHGPVG